jgi:peptidoglycan/xylan/chitin deacetylase (PgdA/CDA1 family)
MTQSVPVLMYHHVGPHPGTVTVSPETFEAQMAQLARAGYQALAADAFLEFIEGRRRLSGRDVLITFDDGYLDNYVYAYPVLQRYGLKATIFAITGRVGDGPARAHAGDGAPLPPTPDHRACKAALAENRMDDVMLRWSEIEAMEASGTVEVHSHTHSHQRWDRMYADAAQRVHAVTADLASSREILAKRLGKDSRHLCWPWGYFEPAYQEAATRLGFRAQYTVERGVNVAGGDPRHIARIVIKDRAGRWFAVRLCIYQNALLGRLYGRMRGR